MNIKISEFDIMGYRCGADAKRGPCQRPMKIKGAKCYQHKSKEGDPVISELLDENDNFDVDKFFRLTELKQQYCPDCEAPEEWRSMKHCCSEMYVLSSLGRCWSFKENRLLEGGDSPSRKYRGFKLTDNNRRSYTKGIHTWQGIVYFGLPFLDKNSEQKDKAITVDHIDFTRKKDNFVCCNLRPANKNDQSKNRKRTSDKQGRTVLRLSLEGKTIDEFISVVKAAKVMKVDPHTIGNRCRDGKELGGFRFRYKVKSDFGDLKWVSTAELFKDNDVLEMSSEGHIFRKDGTIFKGSKFDDYFRITWKDSKTKKYFMKYMNVLVWETHKNERVEGGYQIHHIDGKPWNNNIKNLVKITQPDNIRASKATGKNKSCKKVRRIAHDETYRDFVSLSEAARETDEAHNSGISICLSGKQKTCGKCKCGKRFTWISPNTDVNIIASE
uniref:HNH endonuclease n=1 Tax=Pithovirus LCPAC404 TaxID=2506597 RepID=A0A481ZC22_9VIRU|nr:MAG: HNH endonuclease [Pithovirus LCPAC404]